MGYHSMTPATAASLAVYFDELPQPSAEPVSCQADSGIWSALFVFSYDDGDTQAAEVGACFEVGSLTGTRSRIDDPRAATPPGLFVSAIGSAYLAGTSQEGSSKVSGALAQFAAAV